MVKIKSSDKEVIASGVFITFSGDKNLLSFKYKNELFNFEFHFVTDDSKERIVEYKADKDKTTLIIKFYNFESGLGIGLKEPLKISNTKAGIPIYLQIHTSSFVGANARKVVYTFYAGDSNG